MAVQNITIDRGATFSTTVTVTDANGSSIDLTDYTVTAKLRKHYDSANAIAFTTTANIAAATITITLSANTTTTMDSETYVYDMKIANESSTIRVIEGLARVTGEASY